MRWCQTSHKCNGCQAPFHGTGKRKGDSNCLDCQARRGATAYSEARRPKGTKKRGRESFLIARSETCLITLLRTDLILTPHHSRLTFHVLSISRHVAGSWFSWFIWFVWFLWFVWFRERNKPDQPDKLDKLPGVVPRRSSEPFTIQH